MALKYAECLPIDMSKSLKTIYFSECSSFPRNFICWQTALNNQVASLTIYKQIFGYFGPRQPIYKTRHSYLDFKENLYCRNHKAFKIVPWPGSLSWTRPGDKRMRVKLNNIFGLPIIYLYHLLAKLLEYRKNVFSILIWLGLFESKRWYYNEHPLFF